MAQKINGFERFWKELKRRKVIHVITVYAAVSFVILQLVDIVERPLRLPDWTTALVIVLLCIGFIIAVFVSWVYDITPSGVKKTRPVSAVKHTGQSTTPASSGWKIATYFSGVIIVVLVTFNFISKRSFNADILKLEKSIAVLPFRNDSRDSTNQYFIDGIMEEILNSLQKIGAFSRVLSRNSVEQFRNNTTKSTPEIAKALNVNFLVEGSGQKFGNKFVLRVQLITGKNERHLWAESYEKEVKETKDIYETQSQIAQSVASELKATISPEEKHLIEKTPTASLTALDFYQRGKEELLKYSSDNANWKALKTAEDLFKQSLKYDSTFARAYVGLAWVYKNKKFNVSYLHENFLDSVLILAKKALTFDSQLAEAYTACGDYYVQKGLSDKAIQEFDKALKYNSNDYSAYYSKGVLYCIDKEDYVNSLDNIHKAVSRNSGLDLPGYLELLAWDYLSVGFIDKAKYYYQEEFKLNRDSAIYLMNLALIEWYTENFEDALKLAKQANKIDTTKLIRIELYYFLPPSYNNEAYFHINKLIENSKKAKALSLLYYYRYAIAFWRMGKYKEAQYYFDQQIKYDEGSIKLGRELTEFGAAYYDLAATYAFLGDKEEAYKYLNEFDKIKTFPLWWVIILKHDPFFDGIRGDEQFQKILQNVEAKYQAEHERVRKWLGEQGML